MPEQSQQMLKSILHRGPDYHSTWHDDEITLGHTLLSIRGDKQQSQQPVSKPHSPWHLSFNGQIYNITHVRKQLPSSFSKEELDTTLLFGLVEKYGWDFVTHIEGMFAIALYNSKEKELRLYRDPSGQKNIYYTHETDLFCFASEISALTTACSIPKIADLLALQTALGIGYIPGRRTLFSHIRKLAPGEMLIRKNRSTSLQSYITNPFCLNTLSPREAIQQTIREHLASKHRIALNLSGGLDSSIILHEMSLTHGNIHSYTTRFDTTRFDTTRFDTTQATINEDSDLAKRLSVEYGTNHTEIYIDSKTYLGNMISAYEIIEEPNYNISAPTYLAVAEREGIRGDMNRVVLSGDGGDEVFGGYPSYRQSLQYSQNIRMVGGAFFNIYKYVRDKTFWNYQDSLERWLRMRYFFLENSDQKKVHSYLSESLSTYWQQRVPDPVRDMMMLDRMFWLPAENFTRSDKLYMSQSLEVRSPLSYEPLRKYFDARLQAQDYFSPTNNKHLLRNLYTGELPEYITHRPNKTGWRSPIASWWNEEYKKLFIDVFREAPASKHIPWEKLADMISSSSIWPGKKIHLFFSLAVLSKKYNLPLE